MKADRCHVLIWLSRPEPPDDIYELLGRPRLDPRIAKLQQHVKTAIREILPYQNHRDIATAHRAVRLQMELGRASNLLSSAEKLRTYHLKLMQQWYAEFIQSRPNGTGRPDIDGFCEWLTDQKQIHSAGLPLAAEALIPPAVDRARHDLQAVIPAAEDPDAAPIELQPTDAADEDDVLVLEPVHEAAHRVDQLELIPWHMIDENHSLQLIKKYRQKSASRTWSIVAVTSSIVAFFIFAFFLRSGSHQSNLRQNDRRIKPDRPAAQSSGVAGPRDPSGTTSSRGKVPTESDSTLKLPKDFAFLGMTKAMGEIELAIGPEFREPLSFPYVVGSKEPAVQRGRDIATGLYRRGLSIDPRGEDSRSGGSIRLRIYWNPESFACYRDRQLLGVWDHSTKCLRSPGIGEAPPTIQLMEDNNDDIAVPTAPAATATGASENGNVRQPLNAAVKSDGGSKEPEIETEAARASKRDASKSGAKDAIPPRYITNSIGMKLAWISPGKFLMGSPQTESGRGDDEQQHEVTITKPFYMGVYEVTQREFEAVIGQNPARYTQGKGGSPDHPVENVSWDDADKFCTKLSASDAEQRAGRRYRLPTEAQWEFAARAGKTTPFSTGKPMETRQTVKRAFFHETALAGFDGPNDFGLYDMHGNVWEWCADWFKAFEAASETDPTGPADGRERVVKGGWHGDGRNRVGSAERHHYIPGLKIDDNGFRVVCWMPEESSSGASAGASASDPKADPPPAPAPLKARGYRVESALVVKTGDVFVYQPGPNGGLQQVDQGIATNLALTKNLNVSYLIVLVELRRDLLLATDAQFKSAFKNTKINKPNKERVTVLDAKAFKLRLGKNTRREAAMVSTWTPEVDLLNKSARPQPIFVRLVVTVSARVPAATDTQVLAVAFVVSDSKLKPPFSVQYKDLLRVDVPDVIIDYPTQ